MTSRTKNNNAAASEALEQQNNRTTTTTTTTNRRQRCGECAGCLREDCGKCVHCVQYRKFGGDGTCNQACVHRRCIGASNAGATAAADQSLPHDSHGDQSTKYHSTEVLLSYHILQNAEPASYLLPRTKKPRTCMDFDDENDGEDDDDDDDDANDYDESDGSYYSDDDNMKLDVGNNNNNNGNNAENTTTTNNNVNNISDPKQKMKLMSQTLYGLKPPLKPSGGGIEVCAGCCCSTQPVPGETEKQEDIVLLCDGHGCGKEYHLKCCVPPLKKIPHGTWFCRDCSPTGSTNNLKDYLDRVDDFRARVMDMDGRDSFTYKENQEAVVQSGLSSAAHAVGFSSIPQSELDMVDTLHHTAQQEIGGKGDLHPPPTLGPQFFVGKCVQLYVQDDESELIHTGRIVDYRVFGPDGVLVQNNPQWKLDHNTDDLREDVVVEYLVRFPKGADYRKEDHEHWIVLEEHALAVGTTAVIIECDSRSSGSTSSPDGSIGSGSGGGGSGGSPRKRNSAVSSPDKNNESNDGDDKGGRNNGSSSSWQPAMMWLHSALALLLLHAAAEATSSANDNSSSNNKVMKGSSDADVNQRAQSLIQSFHNRLVDPKSKELFSKSHKEEGMNMLCAFAKPYGVDSEYLYRDLKTQTVGFFNPKASSEYASSDQDKFWGWNAMVECSEQERVNLWRDLELKNTWLPQAMSSRDQYKLGALMAPTPAEAEAAAVKKKDDPCLSSLCPLVARGLDRVQILDQLHRRGVNPTKDTACTLSCRIVSISCVASAEDP